MRQARTGSRGTSCSNSALTTSTSAPWCATSPRARSLRRSRPGIKESYFPVPNSSRKLGDLGLFGHRRAGGVSAEPANPRVPARTPGWRLHLAVHRHRRARPDRPVDRHHPVGRCRPGHQPDPHLRHPRAEGEVPARPGDRPDARGLRPHRTRCGIRRRGTKTNAEHLADGMWTVNGSKSFITNAGTAITSVVTVTARTVQPRQRLAGDQRDHDPFRDPGIHGGRRAITSSAGTSPTPTGCPSTGLQGPTEANLLGQRGARASSSSSRPSTTVGSPSAHSRSGARSGCLRNVSPTPRPHRVRPPHRGLPGRLVPGLRSRVMADDLPAAHLHAAWLKDEMDAGRQDHAGGQAGRVDRQALHRARPR
jgi:hypothetical protein